MASRIFNILKGGDADGIIEGRGKSQIGLAWNKQGPNDKYIRCQLNDDYWIVTDEERERMISEEDMELLKAAKAKLGD